MTIIDKLAWIEIKDYAILSTKSFGKDTFYIPGGKREAGETDMEALCREIKEELTVDLDKSSVKYFGTFQAPAHGQPEGVEVRMTCYTATYQGQISASAEIAEVSWLNYSAIETVSAVDKIIFNHLKEIGWLK